MGQSDYARTPKDSYIISYIIHLFIHSDENKAKTASNYFYFKCIASKSFKHCCDTIKTPHIHMNEQNVTLYFSFSFIIIAIIIISIIIIIVSTDYLML